MFSKCQQSNERKEYFLHTICNDNLYTKPYESIKRLKHKKSLKMLNKSSNQLITETKGGYSSQIPPNSIQAQIKSKNLHIIRNVVDFHQLLAQQHIQTIFSPQKVNEQQKKYSKYERKLSLAVIPNNFSFASHDNSKFNQKGSFILSEGERSHSLTISKSQEYPFAENNCYDQKSTHFQYGKSRENSGFKKLKNTISLQSSISEGNSIVLENNYLNFY